MTLMKTPASSTQVVANGTDKYDFTLKIRDRYGNATNGGSVNIEYTDRVDTIQVSQSEYGNISDYCIF